MSQRASFVTEYIYCAKCADAVESVLCAERYKHLCAVRVPMWIVDGVSTEGGAAPKPLPIIAGKVGGLYSGEEFHIFEFELNDEIATVICHPVTVVVVGDSCHVDLRTFRIEPKVTPP